MVGLAFAALLRNSERGHRYRVTVLERAPAPRFDASGEVGLRVSAVSPGSARILGSAGAWSRILANRASPYRCMRVWDALGCADGPETLEFDAADFGVPELGHIVENDLICHELAAALDTSAVELRFDTAIETMEQAGDRIVLHLEGGETLHPDLLVGADGAKSAVRDVAGIAVSQRRHEQKALVTHVEPERPHRETAWQRFMEEGPVGLLPLADGRVSVVWSTRPDRAEAALEMSDERLSQTLTDVTDAVLGKLTVAGPRGAFPLISRHASRYAAPGVVLVGDAAHSIHPLAGQGVNLGFADAAALVDALNVVASRSEDAGDLPGLRRYERARKGANRDMLVFVDGLNRLFSSSLPGLARLRGLGMALFNHSGPLRDTVVRRALGQP